MDSSKFSALLIICIIFISSATPVFGCGTCGTPPKKNEPKTPKGPITLPPVHLPPVTVPPVTLPPVPVPPITLPPGVVPPIKPPVTLPPGVVPPIKPPVTLPPVVVPPIKPPVTVPPVTVPPVTLPPVVVPPIKPPVTLPPVVVPPIKPPVTLPPGIVPPILPPVTNPPTGKPCPPGSPKTEPTCPIDTLKLGACVDLLGGSVHSGHGDPVVNQCCPVLQGLVELEAALCLCTTLKMKLLNHNIYVPLALQLLVTCGKTPPPGFTCSH